MQYLGTMKAEMLDQNVQDPGTSGKTLSARFVEADSKPKPFDIQLHPSKGEGWRLRYACIEGPEVQEFTIGVD